MAKRNYVKKSSYWEKFHKPKSIGNQPQPQAPAPISRRGAIQPLSCGEPYFISQVKGSAKRSFAARSTRTGEVTQSKDTYRNRLDNSDRFIHIRNSLLPYDYTSDMVDVKDAIELCQKAYGGFAVFRNTIDVMSEFANGEIYLEGGSVASRQFFKLWFNFIRLPHITDQFFREFYRSGNVFFFRVDGNIRNEDIGKLRLPVSKLPIRYALLNPYDITADSTTYFGDNSYQKLLSPYELNRLRKPISQNDQDVFNGLPQEVKDSIKSKEYDTRGVYIKLDPKKTYSIFNKKQDYEPFAIPFGFPVLEDINAKAELKKMDQAVARTVENIILLITMGAPEDQGGINQRNLENMQALFLEESVGRVLVSDYTTKAEFIMPDFSKILGKEKYEVLNQDIKDGLQNILLADDRHDTTKVKSRIFIDRKQQARRQFLTEFLQPEIERISDEMNFRKIPQVKFEDLEPEEDVQIMTFARRMIELGIFTPEQGIELVQSGKFPSSEDLDSAQEEYVNKRKKGYYNPLVGGVPMVEGEDGETVSKSPTGVPQPRGRPSGAEEKYSQKNIHKTFYAIEALQKAIEESLMNKFSCKELNEDQKNVANSLCQSIVCATQLENWTAKAAECVSDIIKVQGLSSLPEILEISSRHNISDYQAAILYHSQFI